MVFQARNGKSDLLDAKQKQNKTKNLKHHTMKYKTHARIIMWGGSSHKPLSFKMIHFEANQM